MVKGSAMNNTEFRIPLSELKQALWGAAVLLRGKINATGYKEYIFPLVFFKRISDVHEEEYKKALELADGSPKTIRLPSPINAFGATSAK